MSWENAVVQEDGPVQGELKTTGTRKSIEIVRALMGLVMKEEDIVVASDKNSKPCGV